MTLGKIIKQYRKDNGMSMDDFAKVSGMSKSYISLLEKNRHPKTGKPIAPSIQSIRQAADAMGIDFNDLFGKLDCDINLSTDNKGVASNSNALGSYRVPILATIAAGFPISAEDNIEGYIEFDRDPGDHIKAVRIKGDSMTPDIQDGDIAIFDVDREWEDGDVVIVTVNGDHGTCKRIKKYSDGIALISNNQTYDPMIYTAKEVNQLPVKVVGRVIRITRDM